MTRRPCPVRVDRHPAAVQSSSHGWPRASTSRPSVPKAGQQPPRAYFESATMQTAAERGAIRNPAATTCAGRLSEHATPSTRRPRLRQDVASFGGVGAPALV